jgi:acyl-CoA synthetase (NDP forming)
MKELFYPKSIAVIGASRNEHKIGSIILKNLKKRYKGELYPINPYADQILGLKCYKSVKDIGKQIDLVIISVKNEIVPEVIKEIRDVVKYAVIITGGFDEIGRTDLKQEILKNLGSLRIVGPNCVGIYNYLSGLDTLFMPEEKMEKPEGMGIAFISQSGAVGTALLDKAGQENISMGTLVSIGNAYDLNEIDFLEYFGLEDENIKVICMYLEGIKDGERFYDVAKKIKKPIILLKGGRTKMSEKATKSHTSSMAGNYEVLKGVSKQMNVKLVENMRDLLNLAKGYYFYGVLDGKRMGVITNGGGFGVLSVDEISLNSLKLAKFEEKTIKSLRSELPEEIAINNPLDIWGDADYLRYDVALKHLTEDKSIDVILCNILFQTGPIDEKVVEVLKKYKDKKPIFVMCYGGNYTKKIIEKIEKNGIPCFETLRDAIFVMKNLVS